MDFAGAFYAAPLPSEHRRGDDGRPRLDGFPNDQSSPYLANMIRMAEARDGFGTSSGIYFTLSADLDARTLPDVPGSVAADATVFVVPVDGTAPFARVPVTVTFQSEGPPSGAPRLLALLPVAGIPLEPARTYAAVVTRRVRTTNGVALDVSPGLRAISAGSRPAGLSARAFDAYRGALAALQRLGVAAGDISGLAVFRTGDAAAEFGRVVETVRPRTPITPEGFARTDVFPDFCVYTGAVSVPVFQQGEPPYTSNGAWAFDANGAPVMQRMERSRVVVTVPRRAMPAGGYPVTVFVRTGGGGDRPLVDRGVRGVNGGPALEPGTGLARDFARVGVAGISWDGPHGGPRNVSGGDEQFLVYNFGNLLAMRDNVRQSALEAVLLADALERVTLDVSDCEGAAAPMGRARLDASKVALFGHSMGASISPLALAFQPRFTALLLSGAGGSWIGNVMYKERPLPIRAAAEMLLRYGSTRIRADDPALSVLEWAMEPADVAPYGRRVARAAPRHVLMMQGIVDRYIPPPVAQATSLSFGLDLAGPANDAPLTQFTSLGALLPLNGRARVDGAVSNNRGGYTMVVRQYPGDAIEDGHEAVFQTQPPRRDIACFLRSWLGGTPSVPAFDAANCP